MRLIDADKLEQIIKENIKDYEETNDPIRCDANKIHLSTVRGMPTVDTEPVKHGHWIIIDDSEKFLAKCSECGRVEDTRLIEDYPYCHCGAKMEKVKW